jgi:hypothetical protein
VYCDYILNSLLSLVVLIMYLRYHISELTVIGMFKATLIGMFKATLIGTLYTEFAREHEYYMHYII